MFHVLIDTCVWLDLAQDPRQTTLIESLIALRDAGEVRLIVPTLVTEEFTRNKANVIKQAQRSLNSHFNQVKDAIRKAERNRRQTAKMIEYLSDVSQKLPLAGEYAEDTLAQIEILLSNTPHVEASEAVKVRAADRALSCVAPCHHNNKNSMADAVLFEIYLDCIKTGKPGDRFAFVTHNKSDFSHPTKSHKLPHPNLAPCFSRIKSLYFINLSEFINRVDPQAMLIPWDSYEPTFRTLSELLRAIDQLTSMVWYSRHKMREESISEGRTKVVSKKDWDKAIESGKPGLESIIVDHIWKGALAAARGVEKEIGKGNLGPWSDFEWGMINGKLSALRWALGDEWDMLDT